MTDATGKPHTLFDREREWETLARLCASPRPELAIMLGRRRTGKSYLLGKLVDAQSGVYYQATRLTEGEQLREISRVLGTSLGETVLEAGVSLPDWTAVFDLLGRHTKKQPLLVILDEFPYLTDASPALPSIIQAAWDGPLRHSRIKLVLCGSYVSAMRRLSDVDQPLYGRRTATLTLTPFDYFDAARFFPAYTPMDRALAYGIFGGMPGHLSLCDANVSLVDNVATHVLDPSGRLHDEAIHTLDTFLSDAAVHYSVLEAIAHGNHTWSGITGRVGKTSASLSRPLDWLLSMDMISRESSIHVPSVNSKGIRYTVQDPYLRFWHRLIAPLRAAGVTARRTPKQVWRSMIMPQLDNHMGGVFEDMCREYVWRTTALPFTPTRVGRWWNQTTTDDVDVVARDDQGNLLIGECKWGAGRAQDVEAMVRRGGMVAQSLTGVQKVHYVLFTAKPRADATLQRVLEKYEVRHIGLEEMYAR